MVRDYRQCEFSSREALKELKAPKLAIMDVPYSISFVRDHLRKAELVIVHSSEEFFETRGKTVDGFVYSAEGGSAWSLLYPEYSVVVPPAPITIPLSYAMARGDLEPVDYRNALVDLKKEDGTLKRLYDYWVLGRFAKITQLRWDGHRRGIQSETACGQRPAENVSDVVHRHHHHFSARLFVTGAGVAGLQSIATARRLEAIVEAYDVRPAW